MFFRRKSFMPGKSKDNKDTGDITKNKVKIWAVLLWLIIWEAAEIGRAHV